jgi:diadenosine tetraphosphatase ApaH/serine/threonine PP2A family protein phosphatase
VVCHGDLVSADNYVSTHAQADAALRQLETVSPSASVLVCGHTHHAAVFVPTSGFQSVSVPAERNLDGARRCLINPGAVGQSRDGKVVARYAVLDVERRMVSFREVPYEHAATIRKLRRARLVARVILLPPRGISLRIERWKTRRSRRWAARRSQAVHPIEEQLSETSAAARSVAAP